MSDVDGVLAVPRVNAYEVLVRAEEIKENEKKIFGWVKKGQSAKDITDKGGYF
jgi:regulator of RNase E activity RraA